jgi:hypothetical protein
MSADAAFWIDYEYDRELASDGRSRFASYVRRAVATTEWTECWDGTWDNEDVCAVHFASEAWRLATTPVMSPVCRPATSVVTPASGPLKPRSTPGTPR